MAETLERSDRERRIRKTRERLHTAINFSKRDWQVVPLLHEASIADFDPLKPQEPVPSESVTFKMERGTLDGRKAYRITCEGMILEQGFE